MTPDNLEIPRAWLARCLQRDDVVLNTASEIGRGGGCRAWECDLAGQMMVLKMYSPGFDDYSRLGPLDTARKHALALEELPHFGVPTPRCLGFAAERDEAALVMQRLATVPLTPARRVEAARTLARLHMVHPSDLSPELADLIARSRPNRGRVGETPAEPPLREITLQHGDCFSVNLAATRDRLHVLDWDLLALGDPMWDLGFLVGADRNLPEDEVEAVTSAYGQTRPVAWGRLDWHRRCWKRYWGRRDLLRRADI